MKYRKKPIVIEAFKWTGDRNQTEDLEWAITAIESGIITIASSSMFNVPYMTIMTLEGIMIATIGDYIIKGIQGEICPCKPDIFEATYELVEE